MNKPNEIRSTAGRLGVLFPGMGAVATTTIAGILLVRKGQGTPVGSITQLGRLQGALRDPERHAHIRECAPLADLAQLCFGAWDILPDNALDSARRANVLEQAHLAAVQEELSAIHPWKGVAFPGYVTRLSGEHVKTTTCRADAVEELQADIREFRATNRCDRVVAVYCGPTEAYIRESSVHQTASAFEAGLRNNAREISNAQLYAWACIKEGVAFANGSPNLCMDFPAAQKLARDLGVPIAGKDLKTGQTMLKTVLAPMLRARLLGLRGWFSTNILGNTDGQVLDDPASFRTKELSKLGGLETILDPAIYPELYRDVFHKVRIEYYPPRGDAKESWDNIDLFGWLGYPMQLKVDFQCRDSILAAPLVLDLILLLDLAHRAGLSGVQEWLSFYFKAPMTLAQGRPEHDLFAQEEHLKTTLRLLTGDTPRNDETRSRS